MVPARGSRRARRCRARAGCWVRTVKPLGRGGGDPGHHGAQGAGDGARAGAQGADDGVARSGHGGSRHQCAAQRRQHPEQRQHIGEPRGRAGAAIQGAGRRAPRRAAARARRPRRRSSSPRTHAASAYPNTWRRSASSSRRISAWRSRSLHLLRENLEHIKDTVAMQQSYAKLCGVTETVEVVDLVEDSLRLNAGAFARHGVTLRPRIQRGAADHRRQAQGAANPRQSGAQRQVRLRRIRALRQADHAAHRARRGRRAHLRSSTTASASRARTCRGCSSHGFTTRAGRPRIRPAQRRARRAGTRRHSARRERRRRAAARRSRSSCRSRLPRADAARRSLARRVFAQMSRRRPRPALRRACSCPGYICSSGTSPRSSFLLDLLPVLDAQ